MNLFQNHTQEQISILNITLSFGLGIILIYLVIDYFQNIFKFNFLKTAVMVIIFMLLSNYDTKLSSIVINEPVGSFSFNGTDLLLNKMEIKPVNCSNLILKECIEKLRVFVQSNDVLKIESSEIAL